MNHSALRVVKVSKSTLAYTPWDTLKDMHSLEELNMYGNDIKTLTRPPASFSQLKRLNLALNGLGEFTGWLPAGYPSDFWTPLRGLEMLWLGENLFSRINWTELAPLGALTHLDLYSNRLGRLSLTDWESCALRLPLCEGHRAIILIVMTGCGQLRDGDVLHLTWTIHCN